jgi:predicted  nucleic acid-binding Zn-ribbon protein
MSQCRAVEQEISNVERQISHLEQQARIHTLGEEYAQLQRDIERLRERKDALETKRKRLLDRGLGC